MAGEGLRALHDALPAIAAAPRDLELRGRALYGAWLCGSVLGSVGMSLHHKLCHVLGGTFDLPHAETHAIMLPHTIGFNAGAAKDELAPLVAVFGPAGPGLYDFAATLRAPQALRDIGMKEADLDRAAEIATANPYANPRPIDKTGIRNLLQAAWAGERPASN
jgi:maleylacetate reductase